MSTFVYAPACRDSMFAELSIPTELSVRVAVTWSTQLFAVFVPTLHTYPVTSKKGALMSVRLSVYCMPTVISLAVGKVPFAT